MGYLYYNGVNYTWNSGSSDGNNYPTTLVYTAADRQLTLGRNGLSSISTFLPLASTTDAGLVKVGSGLSIDGNGVLSSSGGSMVYPSGSGIPTINSGAWGTTIPPSNGYLNYNNGTWSFSTPSGGGDMFKATYDTSSNNVVDNSEALGGVAASSYATLTGSQALTNKSVNGVTLSNTQGTSKFLRGDGTYVAPPSGVGSSSNDELLFNNNGAVDGASRITFDNVKNNLIIGGKSDPSCFYGDFFNVLPRAYGGLPIDYSAWSVFLSNHKTSTSNSQNVNVYIALHSGQIWSGEAICTVYNETTNEYQIIEYHIFVKGGVSIFLTEKGRSGSSGLSNSTCVGVAGESGFYIYFSNYDSTIGDVIHSNIVLTGVRTVLVP